MLATVENFQKAKLFLNNLNEIIYENTILEKSYEIEPQISLWEIAKPILNIHVIPAILTKDNSYSLVNIALRSIKVYFKSHKLRINNTYIATRHHENLFICFTKYIHEDIINPLNLSGKKKSYCILTDFEINDNNCENILNSWNINHSILSKKIRKKHSPFLNLILLFKLRKQLNLKKINLIDFIKIHLWISVYFFNKYLFYIVTAKMYFQTNKLKNLIEFDISDPKSRIFSFYAKKKNINLVAIQFAFYYRDSFEWFYCNSDLVFTWGDWFNKIFVDYFKLEKQKIKIVGSPRFDKYLKKNNSIKKVNQEKKVLIISSYDIKTYKKFTKTIDFKIYIERIISILIKNDYKVFIKIHPLENNIDYLNKFCGNNFKIININEFDDCLEEVDFVISHGSSMTFSALILNKPILYPTSKEIVWWDDVFYNNKLGHGFESFQDFEQLISNPNLNEFNSSLINNITKSFIHFDKNESSASKIFKALGQL
jgi:CDP-glycerol glycerophosphotransferase (TagB/SpsB family)